MSIIDDPRSDHEVEAELSNGWEPDGYDDPEWIDRPIDWLPCDAWLDSQAERYEAVGSELADHVAAWLRSEAKAFRALDAHTVDEYNARAETYPTH